MGLFQYLPEDCDGLCGSSPSIFILIKLSSSSRISVTFLAFVYNPKSALKSPGKYHNDYSSGQLSCIYNHFTFLVCLRVGFFTISVTFCSSNPFFFGHWMNCLWLQVLQLIQVSSKADNKKVQVEKHYNYEREDNKHLLERFIIQNVEGICYENRWENLPVQATITYGSASLFC